jgi:hypothetical protein
LICDLIKFHNDLHYLLYVKLIVFEKSANCRSQILHLVKMNEQKEKLQKKYDQANLAYEAELLIFKEAEQKLHDTIFKLEDAAEELYTFKTKMELIRIKNYILKFFHVKKQ